MCDVHHTQWKQSSHTQGVFFIPAKQVRKQQGRQRTYSEHPASASCVFCSNREKKSNSNRHVYTLAGVQVSMTRARARTRSLSLDSLSLTLGG